ncbi:triosephosphate isomerase [Bradyrhizobium sp. i1.3.6]
MTDAIRPLIAGNWKMNGLKGSAAEFDAMLKGAAEVAAKADLLVCPPATLIAAFADKARGSKVAVGAQDCHPKASGAHTGAILLPKCWPIPVRPPSSSAIPSVAPTTARAMP